MKLFCKKTETKIAEPQQTNPRNKLSIGVCILGTFFIVCGGTWIYIFLSQVWKGYMPKVAVLFYIYIPPGLGMLIGGIGMLNRKYWALRFTQAFLLIIGVVLYLVIALWRVAVSEGNTQYLDFLQLLLLFFIFPGLPLWFLFKKSTVEQFKTRFEEQNKGSEADFTEKG